jgi:glycosyltransferase involved in cell wall biosynthesis
MLESIDRSSSHRRIVALVSGRSPAGSCGVEDYACHLVNALALHGLEIEHVRAVRVREWWSVLQTSRRVDVLHLQYPVLSWRTSFRPLLFVWLMRIFGSSRIILTLHEFSRAHLFRRIFCIGLSKCVHHTVMTSDFEASRLRAWLQRHHDVSVIPIGSNIRVQSGSEVGRHGVVYFGLLAPGKGLERFLEIISNLSPEYCSAAVIGKPVAGHEVWLSDIQAQYPRVVFHVGLDEAQVSERLSRAAVALLPYPDGMSERRGTALAALSHGLQVVSTRGPATSEIHEQVCHLFDTNSQAEMQVRGLISRGISRISKANLDKYVKARSWDEIARSYADLYVRLAY